MPSANSDCVGLATLASVVGGYSDVVPGGDADPSFPGQR